MAQARHDYATADTGTARTESSPAAAGTAEPRTAGIMSKEPKTRKTKPVGPRPGGPKSSSGRIRADDTDPLTATVQAAQQGDSEAFRVLYREVQPKLIRYLSFLVDSDDAEDIASETWLQATRDFHKFHGTMDNFRGWMTTIARHRALDHLRKHSRQPPAVPIPVEEFTFFASADDTEARAIESITTDDAVKLISTLPKDQAEAVMLRAIVGLDAKTAAQVAGKRAGAIRTAAYRGLKTLAKRLGLPEEG